MFYIGPKSSYTLALQEEATFFTSLKLICRQFGNARKNYSQ